MTKRDRNSEVISLNNIHCEKISEYTNAELILPKKKEKLEKLKIRLSKIRLKMGQPRYINIEEDNSLLSKLLDDIENQEIEIQRIENRSDILEYFETTKNIVSEYYSEHINMAKFGMEKLNEGPHKKRAITKKKTMKQKPRPEYLFNIKEFLNPHILDIPQRNYLQEYMNIVNNVDFGNKKTTQESIIWCNDCNAEKTIFISEGSAVCIKCGNTEFIIVEPERYSNRESNNEKNSHTYQRVNHFKERLSQFQEPCNIPNSVYRSIVNELLSQGYKDMNYLHKPYMQTNLVRKILKKLKLNIYYKHCAHIICTLAQTQIPKISQELRSILIQMFELIQEPFEKYKPKNRINFLSYSYVFFKFLELLSLDELKQSFTLLKSEKKLREQDEVWRKICNELNWPYYSSPIGKGRYIEQLI